MWRQKRHQPTKPTRATKYPNGTYIHTEKGYYFIKSPTSRLKFITKRVMESWSPPRVVETTEAAVAHYKVTAKMAFRNGSLIWNFGDGKVYLIENGLRRHVVSPDYFILLGLNPSKFMREVTWVSMPEVNLHKLGEPLVGNAF